jgi:hypothetical protein
MITKDSKQNVSDAMCWVLWDALLFCNITKDSKQNVMRCVGLSGMRCSFVTNFMLPKRRCWTDEQKIKIRIFDCRFNGSYPKSSTHALEKTVENPDFIFCSSFQHLRLGSIHSFTNTKASLNQPRAAHSIAVLSVLDLGYKSSQSPSKRHARPVVPYGENKVRQKHGIIQTEKNPY